MGKSMAEELREKEVFEEGHRKTPEERENIFVDDEERLVDPELKSIFEEIAKEKEAKSSIFETNYETLSVEEAPDSEKEVSTPENCQEIRQQIDELDGDVKSIIKSTDKMTVEIHEMRRLYHNEFAGRLRSMQEELERYREVEKGRIFDGILGEVARLYNVYESILTEATEEKLKKKIVYMFLDIVQILEANGVGKQKSSIGDRRNTRHCQVVERILTEEQGKHDTVSKSYNTGFYIENRTLVKERVDVYLFKEKTASDVDKN